MAWRTIADLQQFFPNLDPTVDRVTSCETDSHNCVAFAAGDTTRTWEAPPARSSPSYWPDGVPGGTPAGFVEVFKREGYTEHTQNRELEPGFEKVAIYVSSDWRRAYHAAKQLPSGIWASKLGFLEDIEHATLEALEDGAYGEYGVAGVILKRRRRD